MQETEGPRVRWHVSGPVPGVCEDSLWTQIPAGWSGGVERVEGGEGPGAVSLGSQHPRSPPRPPGPLTPAQELRYVALPPQRGAAELMVQPQQQIQEAVEPGSAAGLAPSQPLQRAQPPLHGRGRSPAPGL